MALKAIKKFDVGPGAWRELAVIWGGKAGFFSADQMSEAAVLLGSVESWLSPARRWRQNFPEVGSSYFERLFPATFGGGVLLHQPVREYRAVGAPGKLG